MRWEALFADLEAQAEAEAAAELADEVAERTRGELSRLRLVDRLRPALRQPLVVGGAVRLSGRLRALGPDWLLLAEDTAGEALVPLAAVLWVEGLSTATAVPGGEGAVAERLRLPAALRGLVRDRASVTVLLGDGSSMAGVLDRVGADHLEMAVTAPGEDRRRGAVRAVRVVPLSALAVVRRR